MEAIVPGAGGTAAPAHTGRDAVVTRRVPDVAARDPDAAVRALTG
ncbi:hypothetical protein [Streptomyces niger]|nr:hypothetical protein [Streptomyces niger]